MWILESYVKEEWLFIDITTVGLKDFYRLLDEHWRRINTFVFQRCIDRISSSGTEIISIVLDVTGMCPVSTLSIQSRNQIHESWESWHQVKSQVPFSNHVGCVIAAVFQVCWKQRKRCVRVVISTHTSVYVVYTSVNRMAAREQRSACRTANWGCIVVAQDNRFLSQRINCRRYTLRNFHDMKNRWIPYHPIK